MDIIVFTKKSRILSINIKIIFYFLLIINQICEKLFSNRIMILVELRFYRSVYLTTTHRYVEGLKTVEKIWTTRGLKRKKWPNIKKGWMIHKHEFMMACFHRITRCATLAYSFVFLCAFRMSAHINQRFVTPAVEMQ